MKRFIFIFYCVVKMDFLCSLFWPSYSLEQHRKSEEKLKMSSIEKDETQAKVLGLAKDRDEFAKLALERGKALEVRICLHVFKKWYLVILYAYSFGTIKPLRADEDLDMGQRVLTSHWEAIFFRSFLTLGFHLLVFNCQWYNRWLYHNAKCKN